jgi:hypothetical protein
MPEKSHGWALASINLEHCPSYRSKCPRTLRGFEPANILLFAKIIALGREEKRQK